MPYRGVVFDLDGTLLDTLQDLAESANRTLAAHGFSVHALDAYRNFVGHGSATLIKRALPEQYRSEEMVQMCLTEFYEDYGNNWRTHTRLYDGIDAMLDTLSAAGLKLGILSNKPHGFALKCVAAYLRDWRFEMVQGQAENVALKPDPAGAFIMAKDMGVLPAECLFLGDSAVDMQTATRAGMYPVGALWGFREKNELLAGGAKTLIKKPPELCALIR